MPPMLYAGGKVDVAKYLVVKALKGNARRERITHAREEYLRVTSVRGVSTSDRTMTQRNAHSFPS